MSWRRLSDTRRLSPTLAQGLHSLRSQLPNPRAALQHARTSAIDPFIYHDKRCNLPATYASLTERDATRLAAGVLPERSRRRTQRVCRTCPFTMLTELADRIPAPPVRLPLSVCLSPPGKPGCGCTIARLLQGFPNAWPRACVRDCLCFCPALRRLRTTRFQLDLIALILAYVRSASRFRW
jgi:hypothetical protein